MDTIIVKVDELNTATGCCGHNHGSVEFPEPIMQAGDIIKKVVLLHFLQRRFMDLEAMHLILIPAGKYMLPREDLVIIH